MAGPSRQAGAARRPSGARASQGSEASTLQAASPLSPARAAVPEPGPERRADEPVWLVRVVLVLFLVGFAAFLAREVRGLLDATAASRAALYWGGVGFGLLVGVVVGVAVAVAVRKSD